MTTQAYRLHVERVDASRGMARFYALSIEPSLFGDICLVRRWGRIGARGREMIHHFAREEDAVVLFLELLRQKRRRGYRPRSAHRLACSKLDPAPNDRLPLALEAHRSREDTVLLPAL